MTELDRIGGLYFSALLESSLSTERYNRQRIVSGFHIWVTMVSLPQAHEGSGFASTSDCLCRISLPKTPILRNWCIWVRKLQSHAGRLNKKTHLQVADAYCEQLRNSYHLQAGTM